MDRLLEILKEGYTVRLREEYGEVEVRVQKEDLYAQVKVRTLDVNLANFDLILLTVDQCVEYIKDLEG